MFNPCFCTLCTQQVMQVVPVKPFRVSFHSPLIHPSLLSSKWRARLRLKMFYLFWKRHKWQKHFAICFLVFYTRTSSGQNVGPLITLKVKMQIFTTVCTCTCTEKTINIYYRTQLPISILNWPFWLTQISTRLSSATWEANKIIKFFLSRIFYPNFRPTAPKLLLSLFSSSVQ